PRLRRDRVAPDHEPAVPAVSDDVHGDGGITGLRRMELVDRSQAGRRGQTRDDGDEDRPSTLTRRLPTRVAIR
ncbi:MAG TPA: hypothetical protein VLK35_19020, partial [Methylomirabilota bacterium]|nr:hypothetical protein [Methylomirabilota bacterium]